MIKIVILIMTLLIIDLSGCKYQGKEPELKVEQDSSQVDTTRKSIHQFELEKYKQSEKKDKNL